MKKYTFGTYQTDEAEINLCTQRKFADAIWFRPFDPCDLSILHEWPGISPCDFCWGRSGMIAVAACKVAIDLFVKLEVEPFFAVRVSSFQICSTWSVVGSICRTVLYDDPPPKIRDVVTLTSTTSP